MRLIRMHWGVNLLVLTVAVAAIVIAALAYATPSTAGVGPNVCSYYSNATYKTVVGARGTGCCGTVISWGITTPYKKCQVIYCTQAICPN